MANINLDTYIDTNQGGRKENQDYGAQIDTKLGKLAIVCDGVGGLKGGALASELAAKAILNEFINASGNEDPLELLRAAIEKANRIVFERSRSDNDVRGMATTVAALLITPTKAYTANVGDSRVYLIREGKRIFRTRDHSVAQGKLDRGEIKEKEMRFDKESNVITQALGRQEKAEIALNILDFRPMDVFLVTSDGIHGEIDEKDILTIVGKSRSAQQVAQNLMGTCHANGIQSKGGSHDNLTVISIAVLPQGQALLNSQRVKWEILAGICVILVGVLAWLIFRSKNPEIVDKNIRHNSTASNASAKQDTSLIIADIYKKRLNELCNKIKQTNDVNLKQQFDTEIDKSSENFLRRKDDCNYELLPQENKVEKEKAIKKINDILNSKIYNNAIQTVKPTLKQNSTQHHAKH